MVTQDVYIDKNGGLTFDPAKGVSLALAAGSDEIGDPKIVEFLAAKEKSPKGEKPKGDETPKQDDSAPNAGDPGAKGDELPKAQEPSK
jgi:hypothetical protein